MQYKAPLIIVESPTKARTIRKFLDKNCEVVACNGHIRDLPQSAKDIPEKYKKAKWSNLGIDVENNFAPLYIVPNTKKKIVKELKDLIKSCDAIYLATDEDREGESISWHLLEELKLEKLQPKVPIHRMVFHEITKEAIRKAFTTPRQIDLNLVHAQEARRILDRLVGYSISPRLWKKIAFGLSAGRVQSAALKAVVDRERARLKFKSASYASLVAKLEQSNKPFEARLVEWQNKTVASSKDFDEANGELKAKLVSDQSHVILSMKDAENIKQHIAQNAVVVTQLQNKEVFRQPPVPYITSTLQQDASRKMSCSAEEVMKTAQRLYENGHITYMRTDSTFLSAEALENLGRLIEQRYGPEYLNSEDSNKRGAQKSKNAQEAHEAIRPSLEFILPSKTGLSGRELDLYELIWSRTLASQMAASKQLQISADLKAGEAKLRANGLRILFPGFLSAYVENVDDAEKAMDDKEKILPDLKQGDKPHLASCDAFQHQTKPPARFSEAALIQYMEKEGIGRPSTYATIVKTLVDRGYAKRLQNQLSPTFTAFAVVQFLEWQYRNFVDVKFTSQMEGSLDEIANGKLNYLPYLKKFYSDPEQGLLHQIEVEEKQSTKVDAKKLDLPNIDPRIHIFVGKFGPYFKLDNQAGSAAAVDSEEPQLKGSIPEDVGPGDITADKLMQLVELQKKGADALGKDPATGFDVFLKTGSYGPYLQLGEAIDDKSKPKRSSIPPGISLENMDLATALKILELPKKLGVHPETQKDMVLGVGRFGPYIFHNAEYRSVPKTDSVLEVTLKRALEILAEPKGVRGKRSFKPAAVKVVGEHPKTKQKIELFNGRYGFYLKYQEHNIPIPKEQQSENITLEQALKAIEVKLG